MDSESRTPASRYIAKRTFRIGVSKGRVVMTHEVNCSVLFLGASDLSTPRNVDVTVVLNFLRQHGYTCSVVVVRASVTQVLQCGAHFFKEGKYVRP